MRRNRSWSMVPSRFRHYQRQDFFGSWIATVSQTGWRFGPSVMELQHTTYRSPIPIFKFLRSLWRVSLGKARGSLLRNWKLTSIDHFSLFATIEIYQRSKTLSLKYISGVRENHAKEVCKPQKRQALSRLNRNIFVTFELEFSFSSTTQIHRPQTHRFLSIAFRRDISRNSFSLRTIFEPSSECIIYSGHFFRVLFLFFG